jgi:hypothetical protein
MCNMALFEQMVVGKQPVKMCPDKLPVCLLFKLMRTGLCFVVLVPATLAGAGDESRMDAFAKCLTAKKATMYGSLLCSHCDDQKKLFRSSFVYVTYIECSVPFSRQVAPACQAAGIRYTPTWIFADGERREGIQTLEQLSKKTGCPLQ